MARHRYRAATAQGRIRCGELDALGTTDLELRLARAGLTLIDSSPVDDPARDPARPPGRRIPRRELIDFCFHLEQHVIAGVPLIEGLADLRDGTPHRRFRHILATVADDIAGGAPLSAACARHPGAFDAIFVGMLRAGEDAGQLPRILHELAAALRREDELAAFARRAAIYPAVVGSLLLVAVVIALVFVMPQLATLFQSLGERLPLQTRLLLGLSGFVADHGIALAAVTLFAGVAARQAFARSPAARHHVERLLLRAPVLGPVQRRILLARASNLFALMYAAGIPIIDALRSAAHAAGNGVLRAALEDGAARIDRGHNLAEALGGSPLFPPRMVRMVQLGERTGALERTLADIAAFQQREVCESVARLQAAVEPLLTVVLGLLMLWITSAVLGPIYDLLTRLPL